MQYKLSNPQKGYLGEFSIRCPHCQNIGIFQNLTGQDVFSQTVGETQYAFGQRKCPNTACHGHIFLIVDRTTSKVYKTFPESRIPFDKSRIPDRILATIDEALTCHSSGCFIASAIMIRKTLEEIAFDKGIVSGKKTLYERLKLLGETIVMPLELIEAMNELRLLGNDAAHIEAKTYEEIGKDEIEISIEFTKEILKAAYQYEDLLGKLRSLKKIHQPTQE